MERGDLFIVSAPSGAGKTTLIQRMLDGPLGADGKLAFSVSHTTRPPRPGEHQGDDYYFVDLPTFHGMVADGRFLEWAQVHGNCYGTSKQEVLPRLGEGLDVLLDIDVQGADQVLASHPEACSVFILPPSFRDLERRLALRGLDGPAEVRRRLDASRWEIERYDRYRYVIINDDAVRASAALAAIIVAQRHRRERLHGRVQEVVKDFQDPRD